MSPSRPRPGTALADDDVRASAAHGLGAGDRDGSRAPRQPATAVEQAAQEEADRHLHLVPRPRRLRANRHQLLIGLVIAGASAMCLALVALHVLMAENQFTLDRLQQQSAVQQAHYEQVSLQVAQLEAPARIVRLAEGKLGMVQPASVTYLPAITASDGPAPDRAGGGRPGGARAPEGGKASAGPNGSGPTASGPADRSSRAPSEGTVPAPAGDADWPAIKPFLSGNP